MSRPALKQFLFLTVKRLKLGDLYEGTDQLLAQHLKHQLTGN